ncbi:hypothetical protein FO440_22040 [Mucilaginibacter corticis]|uniref:RRM domain-containing protein n=1 Tax=Mucilaginibacter corticis TaxID=2597670 RepID=A0A556M9B4_9SPHI|nr:RNA-binding protein [Mucilaginibacter corticis]TSJ36514.1 hypothetical protein FO440_22040 [Mucilaginibacter corticis]
MTSKLFVVGFPREMTETTLLDVFSMHGSVVALNIVKDKAAGFSLGYGFVEMSVRPFDKRPALKYHAKETAETANELIYK